VAGYAPFCTGYVIVALAFPTYAGLRGPALYHVMETIRPFLESMYL